MYRTKETAGKPAITAAIGLARRTLILLIVLALSAGQASVAEAFKSPLEEYLNPFGDEWRLAERNPDIPLMAPIACLRALPEDLRAATPEQNAFLSQLAAPLVWGGCINVMSPPELVPRDLLPQASLDRIAELKSHHPGQRFLGYTDVAQFSSALAGFQDIAKDHQDWFIHHAVAPAGGDSIVRMRSGAKMMDITNAEFQRFIADHIKLSLETYGLDGLLIDGVSPTPANRTDPENVPKAIRDGWAAGWVDLIRAVKQAVGEEKLVFANVNESEAEMVRSVIGGADGVFLEDPLGALAIDLEKSRKRAYFENAVSAAASQDKYVINSVNTNINRTTFATTSAELEQRYATYYTAGHLMFFEGTKALMLYYTPSRSGVQFRSQPFFTDWNLRVGPSKSRYELVADGVYRREFQNAWVYLNNGEEPYEAGFPEPVRTPEGEQVELYTVPPKSGMIFMREPLQTRQ